MRCDKLDCRKNERTNLNTRSDPSHGCCGLPATYEYRPLWVIWAVLSIVVALPVRTSRRITVHESPLGVNCGPQTFRRLTTAYRSRSGHEWEAVRESGAGQKRKSPRHLSLCDSGCRGGYIPSMWKGTQRRLAAIIFADVVG